jgi:lipopolysaccharide export system protein LptA
MSKLWTLVAMVLVATGLAAADPVTIEVVKDRLKVRFADLEGTAEKASVDPEKGRVTLSGSVELTQRSKTGGVPNVIHGQMVVYSFREQNIISVSSVQMKLTRTGFSGTIKDLPNVRVWHSDER